jgi:solute carrier family 26 (sodium-independent sulfate anion transporter), member 11
LVGLIIPELPAIVIILIIEHIAIAKSFGRIFNYTISPSQEIVAQGAANLLGPFVGGYVCTGSFGASAVLSKAGVRTPLAGLFSAMILVLALYVLTGVFFYIPMAALAGLIIHAVSNLMTPPKTLYKYWQLSPFELFIWAAGVLVAMFQSLEMSIYVTIGLSAALLLVRLSRSKGRLMGTLKVYEITGEAEGHLHGGKLSDDESSAEDDARAGCHHQQSCRTTFVPLDRRDGSNPAVEVDPVHPGVFIYRFTEGFNYTNQAQHVGALQAYVLAHTRRTTVEEFTHKSVGVQFYLPPQ